jgi:hypothetical protein
MKRYLLIAAGAAAAGLVSVQVALAGEGSPSYPPTPTDTPTVLPTVIHNTGADLVLGFVVLVALVALGATALFLARRRAARTEATV